MDTKPYFKVVVRHGDRLGSVVAGGYAYTDYIVGHWVQAPSLLRMYGYHLLVFDESLAAFIFAAGGGRENAFVYKCEVKGIIKDIPELVSIPRFDSFVNNLFTNRPPRPHATAGFMSIFDWPPHTVMVEQVKLTERASWKVIVVR